MSDANRVGVAITEETDFGTIPSNPVFERLRLTGTPNLGYQPQTVTSNEIRSDRQVTDLILVGAQAQGDIGHEVSFAALDTELQGAMFSTWQNKPTKYNATADSSITAVTNADDTFTLDAGGTAFIAGHVIKTTGFTNAANNNLFKVDSSTGTTIVAAGTPTLTDESAPPAGARIRVVGFEGAAGDIDAVTSGGNAWTSSSLDFTTLGLVAGEWLKVSDETGKKFATTPACNGWYRISAIAANRLSFDVVPTSFAASAETSSTIRAYLGDYIRNGTTKRSYALERAFNDHSPVTYEYLRGMTISAMALNFQAQSILTANTTFMGKDAVMQDSGAWSGASYTAAPTNSVLNTSSNVGRIAENGVAVASPNYIMAASIQINNNTRQQNAVGSLGAIGIGAGEFGVTGNIETYFGNKALADKVINQTATSLDIRVADTAGQTLLFDLPQVKYASGSPNVTGKNTDVMLPLGFQAYMHPTLGYTMHLQRFHHIA